METDNERLFGLGTVRMKSVQDIFQLTSLAEAAYTRFEVLEGVVTPARVIAALAGATDGSRGHFASPHAQALGNRWSLEAYLPDTTFDYSASLFSDSTRPGTYVYAIRGTQGLFDLAVAEDRKSTRLNSSHRQ